MLDDELLENKAMETSFGDIGGEEAVRDENEGKEFIEGDARYFFIPQTLRPMDVLQLPIAYNSYSPSLSGFTDIHIQHPTAASQHESAQESPSSSTYGPYSDAYSWYARFLPESLGLSEEEYKAATKLHS